MNSPLEQYLETVRHTLWCVPARWRDEQIIEVRHHLIAHVDELTAAGIATQEAEEEAVRHFGEAHITARSLIFAWWRQLLPLDKATQRPALIAAMGVCVASGLLVLLPMPLAEVLRSLGPYAFGATLAAVFQSMSLLSYFLVGIVAGHWGRQRAVVGTFWGGWVTCLILAIAGRIYNTIQMNNPVVRQQYEEAMARVARGDASVSVTVVPPYALPLQIFCLIAALCLGAYLGARRHQPRRAVA